MICLMSPAYPLDTCYLAPIYGSWMDDVPNTAWQYFLLCLVKKSFFSEFYTKYMLSFKVSSLDLMGNTYITHWTQINSHSQGTPFLPWFLPALCWEQIGRNRNHHHQPQHTCGTLPIFLLVLWVKKKLTLTISIWESVTVFHFTKQMLIIHVRNLSCIIYTVMHSQFWKASWYYSWLL